MVEWDDYSELEQFQSITNAENYAGINNSKIIIDIIKNPENICYLKGERNKQEAINNISIFNYNFKLFSLLYKYYPNGNYTLVVHTLLTLQKNNEDISNCSYELFLYITRHITQILVNAANVDNFFAGFKKWLNKEMIIDIINSLPIKFYYYDKIYDYCELYYDKEFKKQVEFLNTIRGTK